MIAVDKELWLFCEAGQPGKREIWWTPVLPGSIDNETPDKAFCSYPARNLSLHPADDSNPAAVALGNQVWVFWQSNRRGPTDIWARVHKDGSGGPPWRITTAGIRHWAPAAVVDNNNTLWLFTVKITIASRNCAPGCGTRLLVTAANGLRRMMPARTDRMMNHPPRLSRGTKYGCSGMSKMSKDGGTSGAKLSMVRWGRKVQVTDHPSGQGAGGTGRFEGSAACLLAVTAQGLIFRVQGQSPVNGYPLQSCTADTRNAEMLAHVRLQKEAFENRAHYTYDTRVHDTNQVVINNDAWCARDTEGVYLTPDTLDAELIVRGQELVNGLIQRFPPAQTRIVFVIEPPVVFEKVYTYDFPTMRSRLASKRNMWTYLSGSSNMTCREKLTRYFVRLGPVAVMERVLPRARVGGL